MELNQLHEPDALFQLKKEEMSPDQRKILMYLLFLKEKCDWTIKVRGCANGRSQREYTTRLETTGSSLTGSLWVMMMSCTIDMKEHTVDSTT